MKLGELIPKLQEILRTEGDTGENWERSEPNS